MIRTPILQVPLVILLCCVVFINSEHFIKITAQDAVIGHRSDVSNNNQTDVSHNTTKTVNALLQILQVLDKFNNSSESDVSNQTQTISSQDKSETRQYPSWLNIFKYNFNKRKHSTSSSGRSNVQSKQVNNRKNLLHPIYLPTLHLSEKVNTKTANKPLLNMTPASDSSNIDEIINVFENLPKYDDAFKPITNPSV